VIIRRFKQRRGGILHENSDAFYSLAAIVCTASSRAWCVCDQTAGLRVASQVTSDFAALVGFAKAACTPATDGPQCSIVCFSYLNISGDNRNLVLTVITASAGKRMREAGLDKFSRVSFSDREMLLSRKAFGISASAANLHREIIQG
jgi:hypothetical protein